jgi:hypothetical protein
MTMLHKKIVLATAMFLLLFKIKRKKIIEGSATFQMAFLTVLRSQSLSRSRKKAASFLYTVAGAAPIFILIAFFIIVAIGKEVILMRLSNTEF